MGIRSRLGFFGLVAAFSGAVGCSGDGGPAATDTEYTLTCPASQPCGSLSDTTCLRPEGGAVGEREIFAENGELSCDDETTTIVVCEATETTDDRLIVQLEATAGAFGFDTRIVASGDGASIDGSCEVTVMEDELAYGGMLGTCGIEPPSMDQPCQISNFTVDEEGPVNVSFDVECVGLLSSVTEEAFDVQASIRFARCTGF
ncbi:MAG: hypothetical protein AAF997_09820 [Myxococcota bacterium]